jgi:1,4-dihydroxy-2-naphthoate octaprenyltransferase
MSIKETAVVWFKAARAPFLVVSFIPSVLAGLIARYHGSFDALLFGVVTLGVVMAHSAADFVDDYFDFRKGNLGNKEKQFHDSPLIDGRVRPGQVMAAALVCVAIAAGTGIYAFSKAGTPVLWMMGLGGFIVFFYTSPPFKLNYRGLGETALLVAFGPMIVWGVYFVLNPRFAIEPLLASLPLGIFTMNVGLVSNTFDHDDDVKSGKRTFPVRFGQARAVRLLLVGSIAAYAVILVGVAAGAMTPWALVALAGSPLAIAVVRETNLFADTSHYTRAMSKAIALTSATGILLCVAYGLAGSMR